MEKAVKAKSKTVKTVAKKVAVKKTAKVVEKKVEKVAPAMELNPIVWEAKYNKDLIAQVLYVQNSNARQANAHAKNRAQVSGGGRKPWAQKGTGRARAGSTRSSIWVGGGVAFTPSDRNWERKINKKMVTKAICSMLSQRLREDAIEFVAFGKDMKKIRTDLVKGANATALVVTSEPVVISSIRNVEKINVITPANLSVIHLVGAKKVVFDKEAVKIIEERLTNGK